MDAKLVCPGPCLSPQPNIDMRGPLTSFFVAQWTLRVSLNSEYWLLSVRCLKSIYFAYFAYIRALIPDQALIEVLAATHTANDISIQQNQNTYFRVILVRIIKCIMWIELLNL